MPNSLISLADGKEPINEASVIMALGHLPFLSHQFSWFVSTVALSNEAKGLDMLKGYSGIRKSKPGRDMRLGEILKVVQALSVERLRSLPERIPLGSSSEDIRRLVKT